MAYQSFGDESGDSNSTAKLAALRLTLAGFPKFLGLSVLDVGCNEGFFCIHAAKSGAKDVVGIDINEQFILGARKRAAEAKQDSKITYIVGSWDEIPEKKFDVIFFLSAVHYAPDQRAVIEKLISHLTPSGILVLECGVIDSDKVEFVKVKRAIDEREFPTKGMLSDMLKDHAWKLVGASVQQAGDPIPRNVYHIKRFKPTVCLVSGRSYSGKSTLAREFGRLGVESIMLDDVLSEINRIGSDDGALNEFVRLKFHGEKLHEVYDDLLRSPMLDAFVSFVLRRANARIGLGRMIVVEGYLLTFEVALKAFTHAFETAGCYVWEIRRN